MGLRFQTREYRHRVSIVYEKDPVQDALGHESGTETELGCRWARIEPLRGDEILVAEQRVGHVTHRVNFRHLAGIATEMQVKFGTRRFEIVHAINVMELGEETELLCREEV